MILYLIGGIIDIYGIVWFTSNMLKPKLSNFKINVLFLLSNILQVLICDYIIESMLVTYIAWFIVHFLLIWTLYEGSNSKKFFVYIENFIILLLLELVSSHIVFGILDIDVELLQKFSWRKGLVTIMTVWLRFLISYMFILMQKKIKFVLAKQKMKLVFTVFMSQILVCSIYNLILMYTDYYAENILLIYVIFIFFIDLLMIRSMSMLEIKQETEENIIYLDKKEKLVADYYSSLSENINDYVELRNDYENDLKEIYEVVGKTYNSEDYKKTEREFDEIVYNEGREEKSENIIVKHIKDGIKIQLEDMNCKYEFDFNIPQNIKVEILDLSSLIVNLFDNAIEAVERCIKSDSKKDKENFETSKYHIKASGKIVKEDLVLEFENIKSISNKVNKLEDKYITSKQDTSAHGYGMQIIERIAKKYDGEMNVEYSGEWFKNTVVLRNVI